MNWRREFLLGICCLALPLAAAETPSGPYLGQTPPGMEPKLFAPGIVNTGMYTRDLAMTPDGKEIYFSVVTGQNKLAFIACTREVGGRWTGPEILPQLGVAGYSTIEPCIAPDGRRFFFSSNRPAPGKKADSHDFDIWVMERNGQGWGEPVNLGAPVNTDKGEYFPSITREGTLYWTGPDSEGRGEAIWRARPGDGGFGKPERLPPQVNAGRARFNAFVAPDESFLIVPVYGLPDSRGETDYYVTFGNADGSWSELRNLGPGINSEDGDEYSASLSPDGKYLFFMSARMPRAEEMPRPLTFAYLRQLYNTAPNGNPAIYWVDARRLSELRGK